MYGCILSVLDFDIPFSNTIAAFYEADKLLGHIYFTS